ncbi:Hint domain-containing protein [Histidinibacterium lentulum]|uniref:Hedgehog/Intein (Hint) domain-containing protein n=1 Tax=Histidinibacterium lentulum TaxID=2480588 RepID=A0A3N2QSK7_9RHOB|nr:Hint domain-containing protein [Histidinibacterium lentulum]ROT97985.1 hypothetical protein EAT49_17065 [Histidinibacterium lentulum]
MIELFLTGDQLGTYSSVSSSGNSNGISVTLAGVQPLGTSSDVFRVVVRQVNAGQTEFSNGQFVDIYAWPDSTPPGPPLYSSLNPQHDQFQGRASSAEHQIFTSPARIVFDVNGVTSGTMQYGPGLHPPREEKLSFEAFPSDPPVFPCFAAGTLIETATGPRPAEEIRRGDLVRTLDNGLQPVRWTGQRKVRGTGPMAPVQIEAGALGNRRRLVVSPQHRMLLEDWRAEMHFGQQQVFAAAIHLVNGTSIRQVPVPWVTYVHFAFDRHEVIWSEGCLSESLHLGSVALGAVGSDALAELRTLFPELTGAVPAGVTARPCLRRWEAALTTLLAGPCATS